MCRMPGATAILFAALFVLCSTENSLQRFESECRPEVGWDPCQRACEFEKMGLTSEGKFDIGKTRAMIDRGGLKLYPDDRRNLLKAAFHVCHEEVAPDRSLDRCAAASAIYYCVNALLRPEVLYKDEVPSKNDGWRMVPCRCGKFGGKFGFNYVTDYKQ